MYSSLFGLRFAVFDCDLIWKRAGGASPQESGGNVVRKPGIEPVRTKNERHGP
ncbi:MAG: hypothetical protein JWN14_3982 [Chthonomonadales bacterium]|nr:hypothetical protein [Chthonomonadales bacterium]